MRICRLVLLCLISVVCSQTTYGGTFVVANEAAQTRLMLELRAQQFLDRATFGSKDTEITALADRMAAIGVDAACIEWIDAQFALSPSLHVPLINQFLAADGYTVTSQTGNITRYRHHAWWHHAITAPDQLKQRLAWALIQICVVSESINDTNYVPASFYPGETPFWLGLSSYYDMLLNNSGSTYRNVLTGVTYHPMMGLMLSSLRNAKGTFDGNGNPLTFPDENYAREVMQLFSIGLNELNIDGTFKLDANGQVIPTYDNDDIHEFARIFTGLNFATGNGTNLYSGNRDFNNTMIMTANQHDFGAKNVLNGGVITAKSASNSNGNLDITQGLDNIYAHANVAPFISKLLIQRFVRSNPSKSYIERVATAFNNNGSGVKGDMKAVMKAILTDSEAWASIRMTRLQNPVRLEVSGAGTEYSRLIEPVVQYAGFCRRYAVAPTTNSGRFYLNATPGTWNQSPFRSASVFNFYLPNHQPAGPIAQTPGSANIPNGDLAAPEFQLLTAVVSNAWQNRSRLDVLNEYLDQSTWGSANVRIPFNFSREQTLAANPLACVEHLDKVLCNGTMSEDFKSRLVAAVNANVPVSVPPSSRQLKDRMRGIMITVLNSPYYLIRY
jgi:uncharacterized protein (DUF1800 family)